MVATFGIGGLVKINESVISVIEDKGEWVNDDKERIHRLFI